jgi:hypothetical protein
VVAVEVAGVSAAAVAVAVEAGVSVVAAGVAAGDHQVVVPPEEAVMEVSGTQAAGLPLPEAPAGAAAVAATIAEAVAAAVVATIAESGPERGTGAAVSRREPGAVAHGRKLVAGVRILAERRKAVVRILAGRSKAVVRILAERSKAGVRIHGQSSRTHAQIVVTSVAMT